MYETGSDMLAESLPQEIPTAPQKSLRSNITEVFFDLETTGQAKTADITQIAAKCGDKSFSLYVIPSKPITKEASLITGISLMNGLIYHRNKLVTAAVPTATALGMFVQFVESLDGQKVLIGHNSARFDIPILTRLLVKHGLLPRLNACVSAGLDTLPLCKLLYKKKDVGDYKQVTIYKKLFNSNYSDAHNALADVLALERIYVEGIKGKLDIKNHVFSVNSSLLRRKLGDLPCSDTTARKLANTGIGKHHLKIAYDRDNENGIRNVLSEQIGNVPRVSKNAAVIRGLVNYFAGAS